MWLKLRKQYCESFGQDSVHVTGVTETSGLAGNNNIVANELNRRRSGVLGWCGELTRAGEWWVVTWETLTRIGQITLNSVTDDRFVNLPTLTDLSRHTAFVRLWKHNYLLYFYSNNCFIVCWIPVNKPLWKSQAACVTLFVDAIINPNSGIL